MLLKKIFLTPDYLVDVEFTNGINYVYAYRDEPQNQEKPGTLNNIGKSTFFDLIEFGLGQSMAKLPRIKAAQANFKIARNTVNLIFEIGTNEYIIERSFTNHKTVFVTCNGQREKLQLKDYLEYMGKEVFGRTEYVGRFENKWYRQLIAFYIHILNPVKREYPDPIRYLETKSDAALMRYHLFLLNINNEIFDKLTNARIEINATRKALSVINKNLTTQFGVKTPEEISARIAEMKAEIKTLKDEAAEYRLNKNQIANSEQAAAITESINKLNYDNYELEEQLNRYTESLKKATEIKLPDVEKLFNEAKVVFGEAIKKELKDAHKFRTNLLNSRHYLLDEEIAKYKEKIAENKAQIGKLDLQRAEIFRILSSANSMTVMRDNYRAIALKEKEIGNIEGQMQVAAQLKEQIAKLNDIIQQFESEIAAYRNKLRAEELELRDIFFMLYKELYTVEPDEDSFRFEIKETPRSINLNIKVLENHERYGNGKNKVRVLLYNLTVLLYSIKKGYNAPRFLIHDSIMDGVDKATYVNLINVLNSDLFKGYKFRYLLSLNEDGVLTEKYGKVDKVTHEAIKAAAVVKLVPPDKLLGEFK